MDLFSTLAEYYLVFIYWCRVNNSRDTIWLFVQITSVSHINNSYKCPIYCTIYSTNIYSRYCPTNIFKKNAFIIEKNCKFLTNKFKYTCALVKFWLQKETPKCFQNNVWAFHALNLLDLLSQQTFICSFQSTSLQRNIRKTLNPGKNFTENQCLQ